MATPALEKFHQVYPKELGTVQIMVGVFTLLIGVVIDASGAVGGVFSAILLWGPITFIVAGSLTVAASNSLTKSLLKGTFWMNVVAAVAAFVGVFYHSISTVSHFRCPSTDTSTACVYQAKRSEGIGGIMLILSVLEIIVSICVSIFAYKAVHDQTPEDIAEFGTSHTSNIVLPRSIVPSSAGAEDTTDAETDSAGLPKTSPPPYSPVALP